MKKYVSAALVLLTLITFRLDSFGDSPLSENWWQEKSPKQILAKAQSINEQLRFFHGAKFGNTSSALTNPFAKGNETNRTDFYQRRNSDGLVETKLFDLHGDLEQAEFKLRNGNYYLLYGQLIKQEFPEGDGVEKLLAAKVDHPYEFKPGDSEMIITNDCFVIVRTMTEPLLKAAADDWYAEFSDKEKNEYGPKYIRSEVDFYFRKSDGVSLGVRKRNRAGELLEDRVYDKIEVNQPIDDSEFVLPKGEIKIAKSGEESRKISNALISAHIATARKKKPADSKKKTSKLPWAPDLPSAIQQAKAEKKNVLLDFTGSDWCIWCIKFDADVLSKPEFANYAKTNLVMLLLDFPNKKKQSDAVKKTNEELQKKYKADGFPTYVLLNSAGEEIGRQTGYLDGGPKAFIEKLKGFKNE